MQLLSDAGLRVPGQFDELDVLDPYTVVERYPQPIATGRHTMQELLEKVEAVRVWVEADVQNSC